MCVVMSPAVIIAINTLGLTEATCNYFLWTEIFSGQLTTMIHRCLHHEDLELVHASYLSVPTSWCLNTECFCGSFIYLSSFWSKPDKIRVEGSWNIPPCHTCIFSTHYQHSLIYLLQGESKKRVISKNMAITTLKSIRKGKNWCVLENSAQMLQDRHQTFQNWWKNGIEKLTGSWQPPSKNERNLMQLILTYF